VDIHFYKYHGLGNDYIIINIDENKLPDNFRTKSLLARKLCQRHFSIGSDGILFAQSPTSDQFDYQMQIFNPDGSEAEMCGNGIRMFVKYLYTHNIKKKKYYKIETKAGLIVPELLFENGEIVGIKVNMGTPRLLRSQIPMIGPEGKVINEEFIVDNEVVHITCVNMGNPHCIVFVDDINEIDINLGRKIEIDKKFPDRINVEFVQILNKKEIKIRVWERGVGETLACGTGACASVVAAILNSKIENKAIVHLKGGELEIFWENRTDVYMTGPAEEVFEGTIHIII